MTVYAGRFSGRTAVITGGASGLGLATARRIIAEGGKVNLKSAFAPFKLVVSGEATIDGEVTAPEKFENENQLEFRGSTFTGNGSIGSQLYIASGTLKPAALARLPDVRDFQHLPAGHLRGGSVFAVADCAPAPGYTIVPAASR